MGSDERIGEELCTSKSITDGISWEEFGRSMRRIRESQGLSAEDLAQQVGCSAAAISIYEKGDIDNAYYKFLKKIQMILGIPDNEMPGAISSITVNYNSVSYHHEVMVGDIPVTVITTRRVEDGRVVGPFDYRVYDTNGSVLRNGQIYQAATAAVKKYHAQRIAKLRKDTTEE